MPRHPRAQMRALVRKYIVIVARKAGHVDAITDGGALPAHLLRASKREEVWLVQGQFLDRSERRPGIELLLIQTWREDVPDGRNADNDSNNPAQESHHACHEAATADAAFVTGLGHNHLHNKKGWELNSA